MLTHAAPRMLIIDEIHSLLSCSARDRRAALNAIKYLANKWHVSIVAAGNYEALSLQGLAEKSRNVGFSGSNMPSVIDRKS